MPYPRDFSERSHPPTRASTISKIMHARYTVHHVFPQHIIFLILFSLMFSATFAAPLGVSSEKLSNPAKPLDAQLETTASRVVNGEPVTDKSEYPFVVDLSYHNLAISSSRFCTGTLLAPNIVLTAAHCVLNDGYRSPVYATVGRIELDDNHAENEKAQTFRAIASIVHPEYQGLASPNDVALVLLNGTSAAPIVHLADRSPNTDDIAWVVGYGIQMLGTVESSARPVEVFSGRLQKTALRIKDKDFCSNPEMGIKTAPGMLCTAGVKKNSSACKGDSGGGLFLKKKAPILRRKSNATVQVGIVSYGDAQCSSKESGVFTDIAIVKEWIASSMERLQAINPSNMHLTSTVTREINFPGSVNKTTSRSIGSRSSDINFYSLQSNLADDKSKSDLVTPCHGSALNTPSSRARITKEGINRNGLCANS